MPQAFGLIPPFNDRGLGVQHDRWNIFLGKTRWKMFTLNLDDKNTAKSIVD